MRPHERRLHDALVAYLAVLTARVIAVHRLDTIERTRWQDDGGPAP